MSTPYFNTAARIDALEFAAKNWLGTPWVQNSSAIHVGVSCHNLPRALYVECGALAEEFPLFRSSPAAVTAADAMAAVIDSRPEFIRLVTTEPRQPGDMLGLFMPINNVGKRIRVKVINHLGVLLRKNNFCHVLMKKNTDMDLINVWPWSQMFMAAWRPLES